MVSMALCGLLEVLWYLRHCVVCERSCGIYDSVCSVRGPVVSKTLRALLEVLWYLASVRVSKSHNLIEALVLK